MLLQKSGWDDGREGLHCQRRHRSKLLFTFHCLLVACIKAKFRLLGDQIQNLVLKNGLLCCDGYVQIALLRFYTEGGDMRVPQKVFEEITDWDLVQWNVVINGFSWNISSCINAMIFKMVQMIKIKLLHLIFIASLFDFLWK